MEAGVQAEGLRESAEKLHKLQDSLHDTKEDKKNKNLRVPC